MKKYKMYPIGDYILVEERVFEPKSKGGILFPEDKKKQYQAMQCEGILLAVGSTAFNNIPESERPCLGDVVYFPKYEGMGYEFNKVNYRIIRDVSVWVVSEEYLNVDEDLYYAE